jgi:shikimate dehydrogenase
MPPMPEPGARRAAVLGSPVAHSLSPVLHRAAYAHLGLTGWTYDAIECDEAGLAPLVAGLGPEWVGLSLTMPLKRVALEVADTITPLARAVGAANTLVLGAAGRRAENTDVAGIVTALRQTGITGIERAVILGAGGTAQAALAAVREFGHREPTVVVRDVARAGQLRAAAERLEMSVRVIAGLLQAPLPAADVVISTLPAHAADAVRFHAAQPPRVLLDAIYAPWPTALAQAAQASGARVASGLDMLLHQATAQVALFTGASAPTDIMRAALARAAGSG